MSEFFNNLLASINGGDWGILKIVIIGYFGLLWLSIIIWVTRDALSRSNNIFFQMMAILLNIIIPIVGVVLYLIIRPAKTQLERYYEEMQANVLENEGEEKAVTSCEKCMIPVEKEYDFCPNCAHSLKKSCMGCKKNFPNIWHFCPFCGIEYKEKMEKPKKEASKLIATES